MAESDLVDKLSDEENSSKNRVVIFNDLCKDG